MTILFVGDTYGSQRWLSRAVEWLRPTALVHLGDIQREEDAEQSLAEVLYQTRYLLGASNHDFDALDYYRRLLVLRPSSRSLHGRVLVVDGLRIAGLGGCFQSGVWLPPDRPCLGRKPLDLRISPTENKDMDLRDVRRSRAIWWEDYEFLWRQRADVLVCHEAPSCFQYGYHAIDQLAQVMGVRRIFHGHLHVMYQDQVANGIQVNGVGLRCIFDQDGRVIRSGESDS